MFPELIGAQVGDHATTACSHGPEHYYRTLGSLAIYCLHQAPCARGSRAREGSGCGLTNWFWGVAAPVCISVLIWKLAGMSIALTPEGCNDDMGYGIYARRAVLLCPSCCDK